MKENFSNNQNNSNELFLFRYFKIFFEIETNENYFLINQTKIIYWYNVILKVIIKRNIVLPK